MDIHATEEEQVEAIKKWFKDNGLWIVVGAAVGWGGVAGYRYLESQKEAHFEAASYTYNQLLKIKDDAAKTAEFDALKAQLNQEYKDTVYSDFAKLHLAKMAVEKQDYASAEKELAAVVASQGNKAMAHIARIRLAKVMTQAGKGEEAIAMLDKAVKGEFAGNYAYTIGDIHMHLGQKDKARDAYNTAKESGAINDPMLSTKLAELAVAETDIDKVVKDAK